MSIHSSRCVLRYRACITACSIGTRLGVPRYALPTTHNQPRYLTATATPPTSDLFQSNGILRRFRLLPRLSEFCLECLAICLSIFISHHPPFSRTHRKNCTEYSNLCNQRKVVCGRDNDRLVVVSNIGSDDGSARSDD